MQLAPVFSNSYSLIRSNLIILTFCANHASSYTRLLLRVPILTLAKSAHHDKDELSGLFTVTLTTRPTLALYLFIHSFIHYATETAHITLQTYKIKHKVKTQSIKNSEMLKC